MRGIEIMLSSIEDVKPKSILAKIFHLSKLSLLEFGKMENPGIHF